MDKTFDDDPCKLFIGGLNRQTTTDQLRSYFESYGELTDCIVIKNPVTKLSRCFGFVSFKNPALAEIVVDSRSHMVDGKEVDVKHASAEIHEMKQQSKQEQVKQKVFLGGIVSGIEQQDIIDAMKSFGTVLNFTMAHVPEKNRQRGFGFLMFDNEQSATNACHARFIDVKDSTNTSHQIEVKPIHYVTYKDQLSPPSDTNEITSTIRARSRSPSEKSNSNNHRKRSRWENSSSTSNEQKQNPITNIIKSSSHISFSQPGLISYPIPLKYYQQTIKNQPSHQQQYFQQTSSYYSPSDEIYSQHSNHYNKTIYSYQNNGSSFHN
ncbi:unnamed protein product [Didymodactylos carnosus]|uniref:RRM domain-containing protein n=1 Tax=Didymodactylos carnosus TaxID=1234261 RepID=A0A814VQX0_9BILA|nr:unnamed protein product [Didymodactylos carnosus]CAF1192250.1 unnamed protein product [Didymodactylos carnosus]CAF3701374.1 unnamed protein product [Didymodactylos carnosus]CAF3956510.1 unnamed protein product [Didymodactylos carnosus]